VSLEGLVDFVAFLFPKLWPNLRKLIRKIPATSCRKSGNIWIFCVTLEPETLISLSRVLKTRITA